MLKNARCEHNFRPGRQQNYLGVGVKTLQRWDREGRLKPERTTTGRRIYYAAFATGALRELMGSRQFGLAVFIPAAPNNRH
jgi:hypothetical protein